MRISEIREPGKTYSNLDQQYRNQYNKRRFSASAPSGYSYDIDAQQEIELPTHDTETPEKINPSAEKRSPQGKNKPTDVTSNSSGNLINMPYDQIIRYVKDPVSLEFINEFEKSLGQQFDTHYRAGDWSQDGSVNGNLSGYVTTDNSATLELFTMPRSRKNKKSLNDIQFNSILLECLNSLIRLNRTQ